MDYVLNQVNRIVEILSFSRVRVLHFKKKIDFVKVRYNMCICMIQNIFMKYNYEAGPADLYHYAH